MEIKNYYSQTEIAKALKSSTQLVGQRASNLGIFPKNKPFDKNNYYTHEEFILIKNYSPQIISVQKRIVYVPVYYEIRHSKLNFVDSVDKL